MLTSEASTKRHRTEGKQLTTVAKVGSRAWVPITSWWERLSGAMAPASTTNDNGNEKRWSTGPEGVVIVRKEKTESNQPRILAPYHLGSTLSMTSVFHMKREGSREYAHTTPTASWDLGSNYPPPRKGTCPHKQDVEMIVNAPGNESI